MADIRDEPAVTVRPLSGVAPPVPVAPRLLTVAAPVRRTPSTIAGLGAIIEDPPTLVGIAGLHPPEPVAVRKPQELDKNVAQSACCTPSGGLQIDWPVARNRDRQRKSPGDDPERECGRGPLGRRRGQQHSQRVAELKGQAMLGGRDLCAAFEKAARPKPFPKLRRRCELIGRLMCCAALDISPEVNRVHEVVQQSGVARNGEFF
jgi:hypothetical protein